MAAGASAVVGLLAADGTPPKAGPAAARDSLPLVPVPAGFIDAARLSEAIRKQGLAGEPASAKVLGVYYTTNALADMLNKGYTTAPSPYCKAVMEKEFPSLSDAKNGFKRLVENAKKESESRFDPDDPTIKRIFQHWEDARRSVKPDESVRVSGMSFLGTILDKDSAYAGCAILNIRLSDGQAQVEVPYALSLAFMRIGKQQVQVAMMFPFRGAASVTTANKRLLEWVEEIGKRNSAQ